MSRRARPRRVMFASRLVRVGTGPSWRSPAADDAVTLLFPKEGESLFAAPADEGANAKNGRASA